MADGAKIGAKLTLDGEAEYKKALNDINAAMKANKAEAKLLSAEYKENTSTTKKLEDANKTATKAVELQKEKVAALKDALEQCDKQGLEPTNKTTIKYTEQLAKAEEELKKLEKEEKNSAKALEDHNKVTGAVKDKMSQAKQAVGELKDAHPKLAKAIEGTAKVAKGVGKAGFAALKKGAEAATAAFAATVAGAAALGKAVVDAAKDAAEYGDNVDKSSQKMGVSAEEYQRLAHVTDLAGTSMDTLQAATVKLQKSGSDLDISQALDQLYKIEDADERAAKAHEMFGDKIANELAPMLGMSREEFLKTKVEAEKLGLVMSDESVKASAKFTDSMTNMKKSMTGIKNNMAAEFLPGFADVMNGITGLMTGDEGAAKQITFGIEEVIGGLDEVMPQITGMITTIVAAVAEQAPAIIDVLASGLLDNLDVLIKAAFDVVDALVNGLLTPDNIQTIMNGAISIITNLVTFLGENVGLIVDSAFTLIDSLVDGLLEDDNLELLINSAIDIVGSLATGLIEHIPELIEAAFKLAKGLAEALLDYDWWGLAVDVFNSLKDALGSLITGVFGGGKKTSTNGSHANGLDYVPYDGYVAQLHQGERVLTAAESKAYTTQKATEDTQAAVYKGMSQALKNYGGKGDGGEYTFVAQLDGRTLFDEVVKQNNTSYKNKGYSPIRV